LTTSSAGSPDRGDRELKRGVYWYHKGCARKALDHFQAAHEHYCLGDQQIGVARSLISLANLYRQSGNLDNAMLFYDAAIVAARRCGDQTITAQALSNKAAALIASGELSGAEVLLDEAQLLSRETGPVFATTLNHRAILLMKAERFDEAASLLDQADAAVAGDSHPAGAGIRFTRGRLSMRTDDYSQALTFFQQALELDRQAGHTRGMANDLAAMAEIHEQMGRDEAALDCLDRSIKIHALIGQRNAVLEHLEHLETLADRTGTDIRVTVHFVNQWLAGEAVDAICR
jgi:tetratricopeptide (TPR) repeat protein